MNAAPSVRRHSGEDPTGTAKRHFAKDDRPDDPLVGAASERAGQMDHGDEQKHHDAEEQARPAHSDLGGDAQGRGDKGSADGIDPERAPRHVRRHETRNEARTQEVQRAKDREGSGETHVAKRDDFVQAAGVGDVVFRRQPPDHEKREAGDAHTGHRRRRVEDLGEHVAIVGLQRHGCG